MSDAKLTSDPDIHFDTSAQRWFVDGYPSNGFLAKRDAEEAVKLGRAMARAAEVALRERVEKVLYGY